jgi:DUF4097 and DUF4098 domain-containing protein YvlB
VSREFHRTLAVSIVEPVNLQVDLLEGDLRIAYARDGEVSISLAAQNAAGLDLESLSTRLVVAQTGNRVEVWERPGAGSETLKLTYTIDVPYRTAVDASVRRGKQTITGVMGPVTAMTGVGDIEVSYISLGVVATAQTGNLNFEVVGGRIEAIARQGKIACQRAPQGISAETEDGDISLAVAGDSLAVVKSGNGRIEVGGARGSLVAATNAGDVHVKAVPHEDWHLSSKSGTIHVEIPPAASFELDADTTSGELTLRRDDIAKLESGVRHWNQSVNGGGKRIQVRSDAGNIVIG